MAFRCNCPDYSKSIGGNPLAKYDHKRYDRDWTNSAAGTLTGECKHILASRMAAGLPVPIPDDLPAEFILAQERFENALGRDPFSRWSQF